MPPERYGLFVGYVVLYDFVNQSSFSMYKQTSLGSIHEVEICGLQPLSTYKYYVRRVLLESKLGNGSSVQLFTTLEARKLLKFWFKGFPQLKRSEQAMVTNLVVTGDGSSGGYHVYLLTICTMLLKLGPTSVHVVSVYVLCK